MNKKILIVGLGLIGGAYASKLSELGYQIYALDISKESLSYALKEKIIVEGRSEVDKEFIQEFDKIIFALYPSLLINWIYSYHSYFRKGTIFTDVSGVKKHVIISVNEIIKDDEVEFIPTHPMSGSEKEGVFNYKSVSFNKSNFIIVDNSNSSEAKQWVISLAEEMGFNNIKTLSPSEHDEIIAYVSQLPHVLSSALINSSDNKDISPYIGNSFKDLTRISDINSKMWSELFILNRDELIKKIEQFKRELDKMEEAIEKEDRNVLEGLLNNSTSKKRELK